MTRLAALGALALACTPLPRSEPPPAAPPPPPVQVAPAPDLDAPQPVAVKILGLNDLHGHLRTDQELDKRPVGGIAVLSSYLRGAAKAQPERTLLVYAGDLVGASSPESALLQDEPIVGFLNLFANPYCRGARQPDPRCNLVGSIGNHEFDEGQPELLRLVYGGNHKNGPFGEPSYQGTRFPVLCSNLSVTATGQPLLPGSTVVTLGGVRIGVVGAVTSTLPILTFSRNLAGLTILSEAEGINREVAALRAQGLRAIVVLLHEGAKAPRYEGPTQADATVGDPIASIVRNLDEEVDLVVSGHDHSFTNARLPNRGGRPVLVTQSPPMGRAFADIDLSLDPRSGDVTESSAKIVVSYADQDQAKDPDPRVLALVDSAYQKVKDRVEKPVTVTQKVVSRSQNEAGESPLGDLIADAVRAATHADIAFVGHGGIRTDLPAGNVSWGALFTVQPFGNELVVLTLSGEQLILHLELGVRDLDKPYVLGSSGIRYTWDPTRPAGKRVTSVKVGGVSVEPKRQYRVATDEFLASGGDGQTVLAGAQASFTSIRDLEALVGYLSLRPRPFAPPNLDRITVGEAPRSSL